MLLHPSEFFCCISTHTCGAAPLMRDSGLAKTARIRRDDKDILGVKGWCHALPRVSTVTKSMKGQNNCAWFLKCRRRVKA